MQWLQFLPWYPWYGGLLIAFAVILGIWLVYIVEKARQLPWGKMLAAIFLIALAAGFGINFILIYLTL
jgi:hypothetical protein